MFVSGTLVPGGSGDWGCNHGWGGITLFVLIAELEQVIDILLTQCLLHDDSFTLCRTS